MNFTQNNEYTFEASPWRLVRLCPLLFISFLFPLQR